MIIEAKKMGRNDICSCGSEKKYKNCCLAADERKENPKQLNQKGLMAIFRKMIADAGEIKITFVELQQIPKNEGIKIHYDPEDDSFTLSIVELPKKSQIIQIG